MSGDGGSIGLVPEGKAPTAANLIQSTLRIITPDFFATLGVPIVKGRNFNDGDRRPARVDRQRARSASRRRWARAASCRLNSSAAAARTP